MKPPTLRTLATLLTLPLVIQLATLPVQAQDEQAARVQEAFDALYASTCDGQGAGMPSRKPEIFRIAFTYDFADGQSEPEDLTLYRYHCFSGAYNETHVFFTVNEYNEIVPLSFAVPMFDVVRESDAPEAAVETIEVTGFSAQHMLVNSEVDPDTLDVRSWSKWRGLGDASSAGYWRFEEGRFVLTSYDVDGSYDGAVNPQRIHGEGIPAYGQ